MIIVASGKCALSSKGRRYLPAWTYEIVQTHGSVEYRINGEKVSLGQFMRFKHAER